MTDYPAAAAGQNYFQGQLAIEQEKLKIEQIARHHYAECIKVLCSRLGINQRQFLLNRDWDEDEPV